MHVPDKERGSAANNVLRWLIDHGGSCRVHEAAHLVKRGNRNSTGGISKVVMALARRHHIILAAPDHNTKTFSDYYMEVTSVGRLWRDYMDCDETVANMTALEYIAHVRALRAALKPFADRALTRLRRGQRVSPEYVMAFEVIYPEPGAMYPWTPGNIKFKGDHLRRYVKN